MKHRNQKKRVYQVPHLSPTEVQFEQALLVESIRTTLYVDELYNVNADAGDGENSDMYFEF